MKNRKNGIPDQGEGMVVVCHATTKGSEKFTNLAPSLCRTPPTPVCKLPMSLSWSNKKVPVLMSSKTLSILERWFTGVRLLGSYLTSLSRLFPRRSLQRLLTNAAEGSLKPLQADLGWSIFPSLVQLLTQSREQLHSELLQHTVINHFGLEVSGGERNRYRA